VLTELESSTFDEDKDSMDFERDAENMLSYKRMQVKVKENLFTLED
jgi:hypothetical protein